METLNKPKKKFQMPHVFMILLGIMVLVTVLTYLLPSGEFERIVDPNGGPTVINPKNFTFVENDNPVGILDFFNAIFQGFVNASDIIATVIIGAGCLEIFNQTGALGAGVDKLNELTKGKSIIAVLIFYAFFTFMNVIGGGESMFPFYPVVAGIIVSMGYDRVLAAATILFGAISGFACGVINLYTTGISQKIVGLPLFSGAGYRVIVMVVLVTLSVIRIVLYAKRIKADPDNSYTPEEYKKDLEEVAKKNAVKPEKVEFNAKQKLVLVAFVAENLFFAYGCLNWGFDFPEYVSISVIFAIVVAAIYKIHPTQACRTFVQGITPVIVPSMALALSRGIMVILNQGKVMDTLVWYMGNALQGKNVVFTLLLIFLFVTAFNFLMASGSGKAIIMMPILSPLAKMLGINQQVMVLTYQLGDGLTNNFYPAGGLVATSLIGVDYLTWVKFAWKTIVTMMVASFVLIVIANAIGYGPF